MIIINSQTSDHQYDIDGNIITTWVDELCDWIVLDKYAEDFDNNNIYWGNFVRGTTLELYEELYPTVTIDQDLCDKLKAE